MFRPKLQSPHTRKKQQEASRLRVVVTESRATADLIQSREWHPWSSEVPLSPKQWCCSAAPHPQAHVSVSCLPLSSCPDQKSWKTPPDRRPSSRREGCAWPVLTGFRKAHPHYGRQFRSLPPTHRLLPLELPHVKQPPGSTKAPVLGGEEVTHQQKNEDQRFPKEAVPDPK